MNKYFVFNHTVRGHLHIMKEKICEDSSASYTAAEGQYSIIIVADGHGSSSCFRSKTGSEFAVNAALESLKKFVEYNMVRNEDGSYSETEEFLDALKNERSKKQMIKHLTDSIVSVWYQSVQDDLSAHPVSDSELENADAEYRDLYKRGLHLNHIYGTTLIAALIMKDHLILLQQGDGRCDVFYDDASVDQPVPWDDRCFENFTTSMCDDDVDKSIRSTIIDLREKPIAACYMGSDGVEDSYRTMDGTHYFYMQLSSYIDDDKDGFEEKLAEILPEFSVNGSGDDVSVAGIVDIEQIRELHNIYSKKMEAYRLSESAVQINAKLNSMSRKHGILKERAKKANDELKARTEEWIIATARLEELKNEVERLQKQLNEEDEVPLNESDTNKETSEMIGLISGIKEQHPLAFSVIADTFREHHVEGNHSVTSLFERAKMAFESHRSNLEVISEELIKSSQNYEDIKTEFDEYDGKYQKLSGELAEINEKIAKLEPNY